MKTKFQRIHEINGLDRPARPNLANIPATSLVPWHRVRSGFVAVGLALGSVNAAFAQPVITNQPVSQTNVVGSTVTLCVEAMGTPPFFYQWRRGAGNLPGETNACLVFTNLQTANAGNYTVVVTNSEGSVTSATAFVRVVVRPVITQQPTPANQSVSLGAIVSFTVAASSQFSFTNYQWRLNGADLPGRTNATLVLSNVQASDAGDYTAVVSNLAGAVTSRVARLEVDATFTKITTGRIVTDIATSSGLTWGDYDNDGFLDLFVPNMIRSPSPNGNDFLYRNNGDGTFSAVTNTIIVTDALNSEVGVWGDYDNDGYLDLFVTHGQNVQSSFLFRNNGDGTFTRVTNGSPANTPGEYDGACWGDFDNDGFVDLFVTNAAGAQGPRLANFLYRNNGNGGFIRVTNGSVVTDLGTARGCAWGDYDNDGQMDLFVPNAYLTTNALYRNRGHGTFDRVTTGNVATDPADSRGCAWGDYDNDGHLDLFVANGGLTSTQSDYLHHNNGDGTFAKVTSGSVVTDSGHGFGCEWGDYDNDGFLDLFVANVGGNNFLYHNNGDSSFTRITSGSLANDGGESWGCAWGDYDNDGFLDLVVANGGNPLNANPPDSRNFLYRNNGNSNSWLTVKLAGTVSNRSAIGAKVRVKAFFAGAVRWQLRQISGGDGYGGQNGLRANFGLGDATNIDLVRIEWPSGTVQEFTNVAVKQFLTVTEPPRLQAAVTGGLWQLTLTAWPGQRFVIDTSTNLADWTPFATVTNDSRTAVLTDVLDSPQRFYRAGAF
jgi:hypothetical protein